MAKPGQKDPEANQHPDQVTLNGTVQKPEALRTDLSGYWSRRIDQQNRLVYRIFRSGLEIVSCRTHYGDH